MASFAVTRVGLWLAVLIVGICGGLVTSSARATHIPGATYNGTHTGGGTVQFTVSADGAAISSFTLTNIPGDICTIITVNSPNANIPVVNHQFDRTSSDGSFFRGSFVGTQAATGTLTERAQFFFPFPRTCVTPVFSWSATTTANFTLAASPASQTTVQGGSASFAATVAPQNGFAGGVSLSVSGLPAGASGSFNPAAIAGGSGSSTLTVATGNSTPPGTYTLTITGQLDALAHAAQVALVVTPAPCVVPNVKGKTLAAARAALQRAHCTPGKTGRAYSRVRKGRVISQKPPPGARRPNRAKVDVVVSRGRKP